ncbi:MAG TPA: MFS transporter, partial [Anaerolineales bacterium]|nr:MFS transporter [Anaerolineales bacterium]
WVASLTSLASAPAAILWGNLSDRLQRRLPFMFAGLIAFAISTILTGLADSVQQIMLYSFVGTMLGTALGPTSSALLLENLPEDHWPVAFGWFNQIGGLSYVAGMLIGTAWLQFLPQSFENATVMRGLFIFAGGLGATSAILAVIWIKERPLRPKLEFDPRMFGRFTSFTLDRTRSFLPSIANKVNRVSIREMGQLARTPLYRYFAYSFIMFVGINIAFVPFPVFLSQALRASNGQVFLINLVKSIVDTFFFVPMGHWMVNRRGLGLQAQAAGLRSVLFGLCGVLALIQGGQAALILIVVIQILNGVTWAAISVSGPTVVALFSQRGTEARSIGSYNAVLGLAGILGSLAAGYIVDAFGYVISFSTAAFTMILTALLMWTLRAHHPTGSEMDEK